MKKREQGVLSVEASIVLTLMLLFILFLFSFARVYRAQNLVSHATLQSADAVAMESYLRETALQADASEVVYLANQITDSSAISAESLESLRSANLPKIAKQKFVAAIANSEAKADEKLKSMGVKDGLAGVDFSECKMDLGNDDVIIAVTYTIEMQFPVFGYDEITVTKAAKAKTFGEILFEVSTKPNNPGWGSTSGDDKVVHGSTVQISAIPNYGYKFVSWDDGNTDNPRTVTVTDAQHYIAIFEKDSFGINVYTRLVCNEYADNGFDHSNYGECEGARNYLYLENATIVAKPKANYKFVGWDIDGDGNIDIENLNNENLSTTITVDKTYDNITAYFKPEEKTITIKSNNNTYGSATVSQGSRSSTTSIKVEYGSKVQLLASSNDAEKYSFSKWSNSDTNPSPTITVKESATYEAIFNVNTYTVTFYNGNTKLHTTTVIRGCSIDASKSTLGSSMYSGSVSDFSRWALSSGSTFASSTQVKSNMVANNNLNVYAVLNCKVVLNANGGSVSWTSKTVERGTSVTLPKPTMTGHTFNGWKGSDGKSYSASSYEFSSSITLTAQWSCDETVGVLTGNIYQPYCRDIYSGGSLKAGKTLPWREYKCEKCGHTWKSYNDSLRLHYRMNDGSGKDDFNKYCNKKHSYSAWRYCGKYASGSVSGGEHQWDGYYHIMCKYCRKEEQGVVYIKINGVWEYRHVLRCAKHGDPGDVNCPF